MIKCAIFDLDGTLADSMKTWSLAPVTFLRNMGKNPEKNIAHKFLSLSLTDSSKYMQEVYSLPLTVEQIEEAMDDIMMEAYKTKIKLKPGIKSLVKKLSDMGIKMAIATQTDVPLTMTCLKKNGIYEYFSYITTSRIVGAAKSNPLIYETCARALGAENNETIIFEDLPYGLISSKKVGFKSVGLYDRPSLRHQKTIKENCSLYIRRLTPKAIKEIISFISNN